MRARCSSKEAGRLAKTLMRSFMNGSEIYRSCPRFENSVAETAAPVSPVVVGRVVVMLVACCKMLMTCRCVSAE